MAQGTQATDSAGGAFVRESNRLILCFDGTGNKFQGTPGDTNIVKLYNMFDRSDNKQMHYYQPGIGTYPAEGPVNVSMLRTLMRKFETVIDQALATSFDSHVIAGYKFIMRYYKPGDRIYVFGFSRGAYTARFLSRMISHVGLLSMGNDELVPFAYRVYQEYEQNRGGSGKSEQHARFMNSFKKHFCRLDTDAIKDVNKSGIEVHFLGLFDCVSSVGNLDIPLFQKAPPLPAVLGTADHVRHAVSIDERRVKFKAALFLQEKTDPNEDIKEVWFPGNHGDVGGGWDVPSKEDGTARETYKDDYFQLSDIALKWMMDEIDAVEADDGRGDPLAWDAELKDSFLQRFAKRKTEAINARLHDTMKWNGGSDNKFTVLLWNFMECIPGVIKRWEYVRSSRNSKQYEWKYIGWPANYGNRRDIPSTALFHHSVKLRMQLPKNEKQFRPGHYLPTNKLWVQDPSAPHSMIIRSGADDDQPQVFERNLHEIAVQYTPKDDGAKGEAESQNLLKKPRIRFEKWPEAGAGAGAGKNGDGVDEWDSIYRVVMDEGQHS